MKNKLITISKWSLAILSICIIAVSCSKENEPATNAAKKELDRSSMLLRFTEIGASSSASYTINCEGATAYLYSTGPDAINYGSDFSSNIPITNSTFNFTMNFNTDYYFNPGHSTSGATTKCLKIKYFNGTETPTCNYSVSTNTWTVSGGFRTNSNISVSQINRSALPSCGG